MKGFIFDLDGVIVDTAKYHFLAWKKLANELDISFSETQNELLKGISREQSLEKILNWGNLSISEDRFIKLMYKKNKEYLKFILNMTASEVLPDVIKTLNFLKVNKYKIALGSASKNAKTILEKVKLINDFEIIIDGNCITQQKPNPEVFIKAAEGLGIELENCIVFEDSIAGIQAANKAGMLSIGIGSSEVLHEANYVFKDFTEISTKFIQKLIIK